MAAVAEVAELEAQIKTQAAVVVAAKKGDDKDAIKAEVAKLLELKKAMTALDPEHPQALKDKKKKKKKDAGGDGKSKGPSARELAKMERLKKREAREAKAKADRDAKAAAAADANKTLYGDMGVVQSTSISDRTWTPVGQLLPPLVGTDVWVRARVHTIRSAGQLVFFELRQSCFTVQGVLAGGKDIPKDMIVFASKIASETVVDIQGTVVKPAEPVTGVSQSEVELQMKKVFIVSPSRGTLAFQIVDASRPMVGDTSVARVGKDNRLNNRVLDLRTPANQAIRRVYSGVQRAVCEFLDNKDFVKINTPKIIGGASEGGAEVFKFKYMQGTAYEQDACLAQSPQLYKQMCCACADLERVYEIAPVFRAEESFTNRHMTEFIGLDIEISIKEHYYEVLDLFARLFTHMFNVVSEKYPREMEIIATQYPQATKPLKYTFPPVVITHAEAIKLVREAGVSEEAQPADGDLCTESERALGKIMNEKYGTDFYVVDKYPLKVRPFYTMPCPEDPTLSNSYDIFLRGVEICSGAQRVHDYELLKERCDICFKREEHTGPDPTSPGIASYIDAFRNGALPHGGGGFGLERVVGLFLNIEDVKFISIFARDPKRLTP